MKRKYAILSLAIVAGVTASYSLRGAEKVLPVAAKSTAKPSTDKAAKDSTYDQLAFNKAYSVRPLDWPQWGGSWMRNNAPDGENIPAEWEVGQFDSKTGAWKKETSKNIKWVARLGSQSYGNSVAANGHVYVGTNNGAAYLKRYPATVDLGVLLCFDEKDGKFLWQHSSEKLPTGRVNDWPQMGICCTPMVEGNRLWFVTSRGEVVCLDTEGFYDDENDGPYKEEKYTSKDEADIVWKFDMMKQLGVSQHNMCSCSVTAAGDILFVNTSNGVDEAHINLPAPNAPSFVAMDKKTGKVLWTDNSPGANVLHGQWSSPAYAVIGGVPQVIFGGGDGWLYSFRGEATKDAKPELLWKFDCNPKKSKYVLGGRADRNHIIGTPVVFDGLVYVGVGEDPEHAEGVGHLWCIDPTKRGDESHDVSSELAVKKTDLKHPIPHRRYQAVIESEGEVAVPNPHSALVWLYDGYDQNHDGKAEFTEQMHRTCGTVAIKDGLLFVADFSGVFHCLDAKTGVPHWTYDLLSAAWGSPLIVDGKVYIGAEDGDVKVFKLSPEKIEKGSCTLPNEEETTAPLLAKNAMGNPVYSTPIVANNVLYISSQDHLFAIESSKK